MKTVQRTERQISLWATLKHENVVRLLGVFVPPGAAKNYIYLASEYATLGDVENFLLKEGMRQEWASVLVIPYIWHL